MQKPARVRRYANPATSRGRTFVPRSGANIEGEFHMGGETVPSEVARRAGVPAHGERPRALDDFVRHPTPGKDEAVASYGQAPELDWSDEKAEFRSNRSGRDMVGHLGELLSDEEAAALTPAYAEGLVELYNELAPSAEFATGAKLGKNMRGWYRQTGNALRDIFGEDAPRFASLLAALSPRKPVARNLSEALQVWSAYEQARGSLGRDMNPEEAQQWIEGPAKAQSGVSWISGMNRNMVRALTKPGAGGPGHLSGPKVDSFAGNVLNRDPWRVTNDTWQALFGGVPRADLQGVPGQDTYGTRSQASGPYAALSLKARQAAQQLNREQGQGGFPWRPLEVQETTWSVSRAIANALGTPRLRSMRGQPGQQIMDPEEALAGLTHADVAGNVSLAGLLNQPEYRRLIRGMGRDRGLDAALSALENERDAFPPPSGPVTAGLNQQEQARARRIARRVARGAGSFMTGTAQYARKPLPPGPQSAQRPYSNMGLPNWGSFLDSGDTELLNRLHEHSDQNVQGLARGIARSSGGTQYADPAVMIMLHDALLDLGLPENHPDVARVASLARSFLDYANGDQPTMRSARQQAHSLRRAGVPRPSRDQQMLAQNRAALGEAMISQPGNYRPAPRPPSAPVAADKPQQMRRRYSHTQEIGNAPPAAPAQPAESGTDQIAPFGKWSSAYRQGLLDELLDAMAKWPARRKSYGPGMTSPTSTAHHDLLPKVTGAEPAEPATANIGRPVKARRRKYMAWPAGLRPEHVPTQYDVQDIDERNQDLNNMAGWEEAGPGTRYEGIAGPSTFRQLQIAISQSPELQPLLDRAVESGDISDWLDLMDAVQDAGHQQAAGFLHGAISHWAEDQLSQEGYERWVAARKEPQWNQGLARGARLNVMARDYQGEQEPEVRGMADAAFGPDEEHAAWNALSDYEMERGNQQQSDRLRRHAPPAPRPRQGASQATQYARERKPLPPNPSITKTPYNNPPPAWFSSVETQFLQNLVNNHPSADVRAMAEEAINGGPDEMAALIMLVDAMRDAGHAEDDPILDTVRELAAYQIAGNNSRTQPAVAARYEQASSGDDWSAPNYAGTVRKLAPVNDRIIGEYMANRPAPPPPQVPRPALQQPLSRQMRTGSKRKLSQLPESDTSVSSALARSQSSDQAAFRQSIDQVISQVGLRGKTLPAISDWEDGAEHALVHFSDPSDLARLRYAGAWAGLLGNQRSVLVFNPDHQGKDSVYDMQVPESDVAKVRKQLATAGVPFRTLVPGSKGTRVVVYDQNRSLRDKVARFAGGYGAVIRESIGSGEFLGGSTRAEARAKYREAIAAYESRKGHGAGQAAAPAHGGAVPPR